MPSSRLGSLVLLACAACSPNTDLNAERRAPSTPTGGKMASDAGAVLGLPELVDPPAGATQVPPNLAKVILRLSEPLQVPDASASLELRANDGTYVALVLGETVSCSGTCYAAMPAGVLQPTTSYVVEIGADALHFEGGKPVPAGQVGSFATADAPDEYAPLIAGFALTLVEGCVQAQFVTDESAWAEIIITAGDQRASLDLGAIGTKFDLLTHLPDLPADIDAQAVARAMDRAGNSADSSAVELHLPPKVPRLVITEVLANPAGSEYTQEFVELENLEAGPVSLAGMLIEDKTGSDVLPDVAVPAGGFALIVAASFVADDGKDPVPRDGTLIVPVSGRIGADGLSNSGEPVRLMSPNGVVVSQYGGWVDVSATAWNGMSVRRVSVDACDQPSAWTSTPEMPTPGW
jgi:Arc/MetJ family transcription regulator